jgi:hypothetical protein
MARYYFHISRARPYADKIGTEIADIGRLRAVSIKAAAEEMADRSGDSTDSSWGMQVVDEAGTLVLSLDFEFWDRFTFGSRGVER